jgi:signal transduction histidine kinase
MARWIRYIVIVLVVSAGWLALLCLISAVPVLSGVVTWQRSLGETLIQWLPWALLSPVIFWIVLRFPVGRPAIGWRIFLHLVFGFTFVAFAAWLSNYCLAPRIMPLLPDRREDANREALNRQSHFADTNQIHLNWTGRPPFRGRRLYGPPIWIRISFDVPVYLTMLSLGHTFVYFRRSQQRERRAMELESQLDRARLQALRMQLQPHFLFNTLNAISTLVRTNPDSAQEMIGSLGQMLRLSLDSGSKAEVPLEQELKFLDSYLEIAQIRFGDRLQVKRDISAVTLNALVPTFILQPLVENALKHGIEPNSVAGVIHIRAGRDGERLILSVSDTGVGLAKTMELSASNGISNTKARLQNLYPGRHHFSVHNRVEGGCIAELEIPFHTEPLAAEGQVETV